MKTQPFGQTGNDFDFNITLLQVEGKILYPTRQVHTMP